MSRSDLIADALRDYADDLTHLVMGVAQAALDVTCVVALGLVVYASGIETAPLERAGDGVQASVEGAPVSAVPAPLSCAPTNDNLIAHGDCITALVLDPMGV